MVIKLDEQKRVAKIIPLSILMTAVFAFGQIVSLLIRYTFKLHYSDDAYGTFALCVNIFAFFVTIGSFSLHIPIISEMSLESSNTDKYDYAKTQLFSTSFCFATIVGLVFGIWTLILGIDLLLLVIFAIFVIIYSSANVMHAFPRSLDKVRPVAISIISTGAFRLALLSLIIIGFVSESNLIGGSLIFTVPLLLWWIVFIYYDGVPKLSKPNIKFVFPYYKKSIMALLTDVGLQIPTLVGITTIALFYGLGAAGDYDMVLMVYFAIATLISGISFVMLNKARKLPNFSYFLKWVLKYVGIPLLVLSAILGLISNYALPIGTGILSLLGLPKSIYWPGIVIAMIAIPTRLLIVFPASYLQGRGYISLVGKVVFICAIILTPVHLILVSILGMVGSAFGIGLTNFITFTILVVTKRYRTEEEIEHNQWC